MFPWRFDEGREGANGGVAARLPDEVVHIKKRVLREGSVVW